MKYVLLDTNAYSNLVRGDTAVRDALGRAETVYMSAVVIGELLSGFKSGSHEKRNIAVLTEFLNSPSVRLVGISHDTSEVYAQMMHALRTAGTPIPTNDVWIASQAVETGAVLVTYNAHFKRIATVRVWDMPSV